MQPSVFDNIDHDLLMRVLKKHCEIPWILLYVERRLKAPMQNIDGQLLKRKRGTPQGGVESPLLANLFMHYAFDMWITKNLTSVRFCRYADDGVIHCRSLSQAKLVLQKIAARFRECGLELHPDKTKIVYCQDINRRKAYPDVPLIMTPQNSSAKYVFEILKDIPFQNKLTHKIFWNGNNILIIDNWRILHRREKVDQLEYDSRKIQRIYVG